MVSIPNPPEVGQARAIEGGGSRRLRYHRAHMSRMSWIAGALAVAWSGCCSAAASGGVGTIATTDIAATVSNDRSAQHVTVPPPTTSPPPPPMQSMYLWCAAPTGAACRAAAATLGLQPVGVEGLPEAVFRAIDDQTNDCDASGFPELTARLGSALGLPADRWHDHGGTLLPREQIADIFYAAGCLNCCNPALPAIKLSVVVGPPRSVLVRVWEIGMAR